MRKVIPVSVNISSMLTLSTCHLSKDTLTLLDEHFVLNKIQRREMSPAARELELCGIDVQVKTDVYKKEKGVSIETIGYYVTVPAITSAEGDESSLPGDLREAIRYARKNNCVLINFDRDAEPIPELEYRYED